MRVSRALAELPVTRAAFERGELTFAKVRALTRVATPACEEQLLKLAGVLTAAQLARALRVYERVSAQQAGRQHELEYVSYYWDDDGSLVLQARLASEDGTVLVRALDAARERIRERRRKEERDQQTHASAESSRPPRSDRVEALLELVNQALTDESKAEQRPRVVVHVDAATITDDKQGRCELHDGPVIAPETARSSTLSARSWSAKMST